MVLLRRIIPSFQSIREKILSSPSIYHPQLVMAELLHSGRKMEGDVVANAICDLLRKGSNWDTLSRKLDIIDLNNLLIRKVLLELKEPADAKHALRFFHWAAKRNDFVHGVESYSLMVNILVRARMFMDAQALLESVLRKDLGDSSNVLVVDALLNSYEITFSCPLVFNLLVQVYAKLRMFEIGFEVCCHLEERGFSMSIVSFNTLIHVAQKSDKTSIVWKIYEHMIQRRIYPNEATIRTMISALCKEGKLQMFVDLIDKIHGKRCSPSVIVNTCLIYRILEEERIEVSMALLKLMLQKNMILDTIAYSLVVYAKVKLRDLDLALEVYEEMLKRGFNGNSFVYTSFIGAHCKGGRIEEANQLLLEMESMGLKPYGETFNLLIEGCAKAGRVKESLSYCEKMMEIGLVPSLSTFNEMVGNLCDIADAKHANAILTCLLDKGFLPNEITYSHLIAAYEIDDQNQEVFKLYHEMEYRSLHPGLLVFTSLIRSLCQCRKLKEAEKYLKIMKDRSLSPSEDVYEALITSYLKNSDRTRAFELWNEMVAEGLNPHYSFAFGVTTEKRKGLLDEEANLC